MLLQRLKTENDWDIAIIGGGASGLGVAVDAASRGLKTILFEKHDFAKGTSSKSTKLVHGGVRYLAQGNVSLVREALVERGLLGKNARHLFKRQEFVIPSYNWWGGYYYTFGLKLYDLLSGRLSLGPSRLIGKSRVMSLLPTLKKKDLANGVSYYDGQFDDARLALNLAQTAIQQGAVALNYVAVRGLTKDPSDQITGVEVEDKETGELYKVNARVVVNATGIFTDRILKMQNPDHKKTVIPSQGIHLVLDRSFLDSDRAIMIPKTSDGRVLFIIPWHDKVIAGTTDTLIKKPKIEPPAQENEIDFILETVNAFLSKEAKREDVLSVFSGLRPLAKPKDDEVSTKEVSRSHKVLIDGNLVSIVGGKWTTYRKMAEDLVDKVVKTFGFQVHPCQTRSLPIYSNLEANGTDQQTHLYIYGSAKPYIVKMEEEPVMAEKLHPDYPYSHAQVVWAVRNEMARTVEDFLARRIRLLLLDARAAADIAEIVAVIMAKELEKDSYWIEQQKSEFKELVKMYVIE